MKLQFSDSTSFKNYIKQKQDEIFKRTSDVMQESDNFKIFIAGLSSYLSSRAFLDIKVLLIKAEHLVQKLPMNFYSLLEGTLDSDDSLDNNYIIVDNNLNVVYKANDKAIISSDEARKMYATMSKDDGYIVFVLQPDALIKYFINGEDYGEGIFLTNHDYNSYRRLKSTNELIPLFEEYRKKLNNRDTYSKFFLKKAHLKVLHSLISPKSDESEFIDSYKHLLNNKPEDAFREDLRFFLEGQLKTRMIKKELVLNDFRRLDIFLWDESGTEMFLIEVKWVGISVHQSGQKLGTEYQASDICPNAIHQSVGYLKQLHDERQNIKRAYLVVFDARPNDCDDTGHDINTIALSDDEKSHFYKFKKINDLKVRNFHPS